MADPLDKLPEPLTRKVGPLPVVGWLAAGVGGILLGRWVARSFRRPAAAEAAAVETVGASYDTSLPALDGAAPSTGLGSTTAKFLDNQQWKAAAFGALVAQGNNPVAVDAALSRYLAGQTLTEAEGNMIAAALRAVGLPPNPLPGIVTVAPPPAQQPTDTGQNGTPMPSQAELHDMIAKYQAGQLTVAQALAWAAQFGPDFLAMAQQLVAQHPPPSAQPSAPPPAATATAPAVRQPVAAPAPAAPTAPPAPPEAAPPWTVTRGSTLWNQVARVYGRVNKGMVHQVAAYNGIHFDGYYVTPWQVGQVIRWPVL